MSREGSLRRIEFYKKLGKEDLAEAEQKSFDSLYGKEETPKATKKVAKK